MNTVGFGIKDRPPQIRPVLTRTPLQDNKDVNKSWWLRKVRDDPSKG